MLPDPVKVALVILVPEAEELVGRYRAHLDPAAAAGMPAICRWRYVHKPCRSWYLKTGPGNRADNSRWVRPTGEMARRHRSSKHL